MSALKGPGENMSAWQILDIDKSRIAQTVVEGLARATHAAALFLLAPRPGQRASPDRCAVGARRFGS